MESDVSASGDCLERHLRASEAINVSEKRCKSPKQATCYSTCLRRQCSTVGGSTRLDPRSSEWLLGLVCALAVETGPR